MRHIGLPTWTVSTWPNNAAHCGPLRVCRARGLTIVIPPEDAISSGRRRGLHAASRQHEQEFRRRLPNDKCWRGNGVRTPCCAGDTGPEQLYPHLRRTFMLWETLPLSCPALKRMRWLNHAMAWVRWPRLPGVGGLSVHPCWPTSLVPVKGQILGIVPPGQTKQALMFILGQTMRDDVELGRVCTFQPPPLPQSIYASHLCLV